MKKGSICWITASYFLDVDLPIVPSLQKDFDIDWIVISSAKSAQSDDAYIRSQTDMPYTSLIDNGYFFSLSHYKAVRELIARISSKSYDWYYFDISDFLFLYPMLKRHLPVDRITMAAHNAKVPAGARYAAFARMAMKYLFRNFSNFQVFSKNQLYYLQSRLPKANIFYCPLMLKDYGPLPENKERKTTSFLFFGNIVKYKRLDLLLKAVEILRRRGVTDFTVNIAGYCRPEVWDKQYQPMIHSSENVISDIRRIPNEEVAALFGANDYFVMPYQDIAQSGALTVALNYSMPVIASDLPSFHEFIEDSEHGWFFESGSAEALADVMEKAINTSRKEHSEMVEAIREMVKEKLSSQAIHDRYRNYFHKMISHA
ncbi:MAG: glycosyltransferase [Muribaculaceae bacterium]|nr:glycosyltransferase [Muribaculaceae bacterium]